MQFSFSITFVILKYSKGMCEIKVKDYDEHDLKQNEEKKNPNYFSDYEI